ncbi:MAG TPA: hypothetical protein VEK76_12735 [Candidatus Binatia bacterium]|nr:hypothetical protein [Candidatus Binatia bacterium]
MRTSPGSPRLPPVIAVLEGILAPGPRARRAAETARRAGWGR